MKQAVLKVRPYKHSSVWKFVIDMRGFGKSRMFFKSGLLQSELKNQRRLLNHHGKEALALSAADMSALLVRRDTLHPSESSAETQPQLQPALLRLSAMNFPGLQSFRTACGAALFASSLSPHL